MGYILITPRKHGASIVTWNTSRRVEGKATPVRDATYLGLLDASGTKLVKSAELKTLSAEILEGLEKKHLSVSSEPASPRGRKAQFLHHTLLSDLENTRIENVGTYRILRGLAENSGFFQALCGTFMEDGDAIFALMCQRLDSRMQSYLFRDWAKDTPFDLVQLSMSPKVISSLLCRIENRRLAFCREWYKACGSPREFIKDSTHFYTWAQNGSGRECEEYGWDHHQEAGKRQINVMSLVDRVSHLPIMYRAYPGSINDVSTFTETQEEMQVIDPEAKILYVSDCGYFSSLNMRLMVESGQDFVMEAKWDAQTLDILAAQRQKLMSPGEYVRQGSYAYRSEPCEYVLYNKRKGGEKTTIYGYIYYSGLEAELLRNNLLSSVILCQKAFRKYAFEDMSLAQEWLDTCTNGFGKYLKLKGALPKLDTELDNVKIGTDTERFGFHVMVTTVRKMTAASLMEVCHGRDPVEKLWRTMKSNLDAKSLMTKIDPTTQGQIFIVWGAAVLYRLLADALDKAELDMTVNEALVNMRKIRMMCMKERVLAQVPPRKAKDIIVDLELEKKFPEYATCLKQQIEERERAKKARTGQKHRGRPPKFKLKTAFVNASDNAGAQQKDEKNLKNRISGRRGRPPKKS